MKKVTTKQEQQVIKDYKNILNLGKSKAAVDTKVDHYKRKLIAQDALMRALESGDDESIKKARYALEIIELEASVHITKKHFERNLEIRADWDRYQERVSKESAKHFDGLIKFAKEVDNPRLHEEMNKYFDSGDESQVAKNEFYLYVKQECLNAALKGKQLYRKKAEKEVPFIFELED